MSKLIKFAGAAGIAALLSACGGGDDKVSKPSIVGDYITPPGLNSQFVPFEKKSVLEGLFSKDPESASDKYNSALSHMISETLADYPWVSKGKLVESFKDAEAFVTNYQYLSYCAEKDDKTKNLITITITSDRCASFIGSLYKGSKVIVDTRQAGLKKVTLSNVRYNPVGSSSEIEILNGSISKKENQFSTSYSVNSDGFSYHRIKPNANDSTFDLNKSQSKEYVKLWDYNVQVSESSDERFIDSAGKIIGQPKGKDYSYVFFFDTGNTPFKTQQNFSSSFKHYPYTGTLTITDNFGYKVILRANDDKKVDLFANQDSLNGSPRVTTSWASLMGVI